MTTPGVDNDTAGRPWSWPVGESSCSGCRHWDQVKEEIQREFDQESESFTLEQIVKLGMDQHVEKIAEISASATKELAIEVVG